MCDCEDRPACGHLAESGYYSSYDEAPDYEEIRDNNEAFQLQWENALDTPCSVCGEYFDEDESDEDDILKGVHTDCLSDASGNEHDWSATENGLFGDA